MASLSQSDVDTYRDQGYLVLRQCINPDDLSSARVLIDELVNRSANELYRAGKISSLHEGESFERRMVVINEEAGFKTRNWDVTEVSDSPELYPLILHPVILDSVESLLGSEIAWTCSYAARPKIPQHELTAFPWHQDSKYYGEPTKHLHIVSVWIPLVDADERNGCLYIIPGSHKSNTRPEACDNGKGTLPVCVKAGTAVLFERRMWHRRGINTSDVTRRVLFFGYSYRWLRGLDYNNLPEEILSKCDPIRRQLLGDGVDVKGWWQPTDEDVPLKGWLEEHRGEDYVASLDKASRG